MSRIPVSCFIRTYNEEKRIKPVILAARELVAEVIVIDSDSTDNTREIAEEAGARVLQQSWLGNGHQKRLGEETASHDWLLDLDADEILSPELQEEMRELFAEAEPPPASTACVWLPFRPTRKAPSGISAMYLIATNCIIGKSLECLHMPPGINSRYHPIK